MIIIGEKINATRKAIAAALEARDAEVIKKTAIEQVEAGADYIDINGGDPRPGKETENMAWLIEVVQASTDAPIAVDSADPQAVEVGLSLAKKKPILNSISLEAERLENLLPIAGKHECMVVALLMSDGGMPTGADDRMENASTLVDKLASVGKKVSEIIIDPCFLPLGTDTSCARAIYDSIAAIRKQWPEIHIGGGCSNISFGLPKRKYVNLAALSQAIYFGMDAGLINPCQADIMGIIRAAEALAGQDDFCMNYVTAMR